jgi:hypothetical protein
MRVADTHWKIFNRVAESSHLLARGYTVFDILCCHC